MADFETWSAAGREHMTFEDWVAPYLPRMALVAARLGSGTDRDDILQEALIRAWRNRKKFNPERGTAAGWLLTITANVARTWARRPNAGWIRLPPFQTIKDLDQRFDLNSAIAALPERQRLSVQLFYAVGLSIVETAVVMRCSEGTVKSTLSDARANLRLILLPPESR